MKLSEKRCLFTTMLSRLIQHANEIGYQVNIECVRCHLEGHHRKNSLHYIGLAADLNLFKDGEWLKDGTGHDVLHDFWSSIGGSDIIPGDSNHYSLEHNGRR